jgi:CheY-like chemotaxis protein
VVDDNRDGADVMGKLLSTHGYDVHVHYDPLAALSACETLNPRVAVVDIGLPAMDGYELARRIQARFPAAPPLIVAVTGYGQAKDLERSAAAGIHLHLTKPVCVATLMEHIRKAL